ncbi:hypothetical protein AKJ66_01820 [candidate division MSBL1 archaeon SCGC-AAA259E22]|uniref:Uncharacterized protein n=1 Tax=candidate division MSBL1 archaeon SCGC-AAA259E22 TaxID=1698265 RepID=A0A133UH48_9EURY|nr:hypothetical protein AKJ66_01820 [candidate division MSBL1 archaeon SCGC-AAA259E22]
MKGLYIPGEWRLVKKERRCLIVQTRKITCRLFPEEEDVEEEEPWWDKGSEEKYEVEIPKRDFERLTREAEKGNTTVKEVVESRFFSVADLPEEWSTSSI